MVASLESGWCLHCGRRRGKDGRCANCDPWWTSPLLQVGGPAVALCALMLLVLNVSLGTKRTSTLPTMDNSGRISSDPLLLSTGNGAGFGVGNGFGGRGYAMPTPGIFGSGSTPVMTASQFSAPINANAPTVSREAAAINELEQLRAAVWSAHQAAYESTGPVAGSGAPASFAPSNNRPFANSAAAAGPESLPS